MSQGILIAGYYRSGTSALSGALNIAGIDIASSSERNEHNPRGYFENPVLAKLDLELFAKLGMDWHDVHLMPAQWSERPDIGATTQHIVTEIKKHHRQSPLWAVKHPHLCRLMPIYAEAVTRLSGNAPRIIHIYRDPWVVAHSQHKKNGLSRAHALLLWLAYVLDGERYSRQFIRVAVDYELLVKDTRQALQRISSRLDIDFPNRSTESFARIHRFLTPALRRSRAQGRESTPVMLRTLVEDVWDAVLNEADAPVLDRQRERFADICRLLDELGASQLAVTAALGTETKRQQFAPEQPETSDAEGSPLRPSERTDSAERNRLLQELHACDPLPAVAVVVAVPAGRIEAAFETTQSIERQWHAPRAIHYLCADPDMPRREGWIRTDSAPGMLTQALAEHINQLQTDYVGIIDAGDRIEPDACARLCLFAARNHYPGLIYTDEIVANAKHPWVRYKPCFDIERLRGFHYLGGWLWYKSAFLQQTPLDGSLAGAEDFDLALRAYEANESVQHLAEALYARAPDSRRDAIRVADLHARVRHALTAHLDRSGLHDLEIQDGAIPGASIIRHRPRPDRRISLVLLCDEAEETHCIDLDPQRLIKVIDSLDLDHLVCAATGKHGKAIRAALLNLMQNNPLPQRLHVIVDAPNEGQMLGQIAAGVGPDAVVFLSLNATTTDAHWLGHLQGKLYSQDSQDNQDCSIGMLGLGAAYPAQGEKENLLGPLLLGGNDGVGIVGQGREAQDPGPGGWLLSPQTVDGVAPPCLAVRGELLRRLCIDEALSGAHLWLDLSLQIHRQGDRIVWDPTIRLQCSRAPAYVQHIDGQKPTQDLRLRQRWGACSRHHHRMLALRDDNLAPLPSPGLCTSLPRQAAYALLSGAVDGAEYAVECLRSARMAGQLTAGWAQEPVAITELCRLEPETWLRVNPATEIGAPDAPRWQALFTRAPAAGAPLKAIGEQAWRSYATSPTLVSAIEKLSYNRLQPEFVLPRLPARLWREFGEGDPVGRHRIRLLWIDEGNGPDWIVELMNAITDVQWFVVESDQRHYDGPIATFKRPTDEGDWFEIFRAIAPHLLIRPAHTATWMDCQMLLRGAAASAALLVDPRLHCPEEIPVIRVSPRYDEWRRTIKRIQDDPERLAEHGRQARAGIERLGWIEDDDIGKMLWMPARAVSL